MRAKLIKLSGNKNALRTDTVVGDTDHVPAVGFSVELLADPIVEGAFARLVVTSAVQRIRPQADGSVEFDTLNSTYLFQPVTDTTEQLQ